METYGVRFEGFEPSCGWSMYRHVENEVLPCLKAEVGRWRVRRDDAANERTALKGLKEYLENLVKSREGLVGKLRAKIHGSEITANEVMSIAVKEDHVETRSSWEELSSWLEAAKSPIGQIDFFYKQACGRADCMLGMFENCLESTERDIRFWEHTLELQRAHWVFEKAELKYKTKICRELVKSLVDYIGECRVQLGSRAEAGRSESPRYEDIKWLHEEAQADLSYYRQIKSDIAAVGVDVAIKLSTRKVTQPGQ